MRATGTQPNPTAKENVYGALLSDRKQPRILQKERPLLGKEEVEPIKVHLLVVHLHLRKISVVGAIQCEARGDAVLQIDTDITGRGVASAGAPVHRLTQRVGHELEVALGRYGQPLELAGERDPVQVELARERGPEHLFVLGTDIPLEVHTPGLIVRGRVAQRAKRDSDLGGPALVVNLGTHLPDSVPVQVEAAPRATAALPLVGELPVVLDPSGIGTEHETVQTVMVGVENDPKAIGLGQVRVPATIGDNNRRWIVCVADYPEVQRVSRVDDAYLGALGRRQALEWPALNESSRQHRRIVSGIAEDLTVDDRRSVDGSRPNQRDSAGG